MPCGDCRSIMNRLTCPITMEGDPERAACEKAAMGGDPLWRCSVGEVAYRVNAEGWTNPYMAQCVSPAAEWIEICLPPGTHCKRRTF